MRLTLTNYGKKVIMITAIVIMAAVLLIGAYLVLCNKATLLHINQKALNMVFMMFVMPPCSCGIFEMLFRIANPNSNEHRL